MKKCSMCMYSELLSNRKLSCPFTKEEKTENDCCDKYEPESNLWKSDEKKKD